MRKTLQTATAFTLILTAFAIASSSSAATFTTKSDVAIRSVQSDLVEETGYEIAEASAIADFVAVEGSCLFDAGTLGHPNPRQACKAQAVD